jgi:hypothetical protein
MTSKWRERYQVHPAADCFPMMADDELQNLGEDIRANGLKSPVTFWWPGDDRDKVLIDGRNRLEAMERVGISTELSSHDEAAIMPDEDPVANIISLNIHRRHLTKEKIAEIIVADVIRTNPANGGEVFDDGNVIGYVRDKPAFTVPKKKGGRGKVDKVKAVAVAKAAEHNVSKRTVERAFAKSEGKVVPRPAPKRIAGPRLKAKPNLETHTGIDAARRYYLARCEEPDVDLDAEQEIVFDALREIAGKRAMAARGEDAVH